MLGPAGADHDEARATRPERRRGCRQASHLLAAEDSAEVTDEGEDSGSPVPESSERDGAALSVEHGEPRESRRQRVGHGLNLTRFRKGAPDGYNGPA